MKTNIIFIILLFFIFSCSHKEDVNELKEVCFDTEILPIFQNNCASCHGKENPTKGISYVDYGSIMKTIDAGSANSSEAYKAIISIIGENVMPPENPISQNQRTLIRLWIEQGAKETKCTN